MSRNPIVSVITRTRNRPRMLVEAAATVAAQTLPDVQHIVVNDGGDDVSGLLARFANRPHFTLLSPGAVGRCRAGNLGLAAARAPWVAWLDDDDLYDPDHLAGLVAAAEAAKAEVAYSDSWVVQQTVDAQTGAYVDGPRTAATVFEWSKIRLWRRGDLHMVSVLVSRAVTERLGGFDETIPVLEDLEMFARFAQDHDFHHHRERTATYRLRDDGTNAVTAMRREFMETRAMLYKRFAHIVMPELLGMVETGMAEVMALRARVAALEQALEKRGADV